MSIIFNAFIGPVTVPMVSQSGSPPIPMPLQVPPGHVMQQIVDENGTLRHVILSTAQHQQIHSQGSVQPHIHGHYVSKTFSLNLISFCLGCHTNFVPIHFNKHFCLCDVLNFSSLRHAVVGFFSLLCCKIEQIAHQALDSVEKKSLKRAKCE